MSAYDFDVAVFSLQEIDDPDDDPDDDDDDDKEDDDEDEEEEDEEEEEEETWQVSDSIRSAKGPALLDFGRRTARLSPISQLS